MTISADEVVHWQSWVDRSEAVEEYLDGGVLRRFAAALGEDLDVGLVQPSLAHWAYFLPVAPADGLGPDGHPRRGGFLPPVSLPRRMFAGSEMSFGKALVLDAVARRVSRIAAVTHKTGKSGELVLVEVEHEIEQHGEMRVKERQTLVYREDGAPAPAVVPLASSEAAAPGETIWKPGPVDLFRFSAVTFNSHRIHYDLPYASGVEGYPGLVVHGPFTAARLYRHAAQAGRPATFGFRAVAPVFVDQPIRITGDAQSGEIAAIRCDGVAAMRATVSY